MGFRGNILGSISKLKQEQSHGQRSGQISSMSWFGALLLASALCLWSLIVNVSPVYAGCCEEGTKEVFIEHIEEYTATGNTDLPGCRDTTEGLYSEFGDAGGWSRTWFADFDAWESDWKKTSLPGGDDATWADARDFGYFCGHGNVGRVRFTTNNTDQRLWNTDTGFADVDLEWVTFDTSNTLQVQPGAAELDTWYLNAFQGLHLLIGWHDSPADGDTGGEFADEMIDWGFWDGGGKKITTSWFSSSGGCTDQDDGTTQVVMAENLVHYDDYVHGQGSVAADAAPDGNYWIWSHDC